MISRRNFLKSLMLATAAASAPTTAIASVYSDLSLQGEDLPELDSDPLEAPAPAPRYVEGLLNLRSGYTGERFQFYFRDQQGNYNPEMLSYLNWFMRCSYDSQYTQIDVRVLEMLNYIAKWWPGNPEVTVNSAYRTPQYNRVLARSNENVAKNSLHMYGQAIDFSIKGVPIRQVCQVAQTVRNMVGAGGVGYYPKSNFVHIDCGQRAATWMK